jgi:hypothetical protein
MCDDVMTSRNSADLAPTASPRTSDPADAPKNPSRGIGTPLSAGARRERRPSRGFNHANRVKTAHPDGPHPRETNPQHEERLSCPTNA